jgi:hypothetical protein
MHQQVADSVVRILDFPDVLSKEAVAEFNFDDRNYDLVGPVLFCSCYRHTSLGISLPRKCLVTRRGALMLLRAEKDDDALSQQRTAPTTSSSSQHATSIPNVSHFIEFATGGFLVEHHTTATTSEREMHFRITATSSPTLTSSDSIGTSPQRGGGAATTPAPEPVLLRFGANDGAVLVKVLQHFAQFIPSLQVRSEFVPFPEFGAASPLAKLKGAFNSFRKESTATTKHLKGSGSVSTPVKPRSSSIASSTMSTPTARPEAESLPPLSPQANRPKGLQHFPEDELVPIDALKKRKALPAEEIDRIHQQLTNIYTFYAPDKAHTVADLLMKYKGMEDLLLIKVVVKYGASNAVAQGLQHGVGSSTEADQDLSNMDRERRNVSQPTLLNAHPTALRHGIDDVDLVDSDDLASVRLTEDSNDLTDVDEVEDLMLEINVLERACDRMVWGAAAAAANQPRDAVNQPQQNIIQATRQRATSLAQCVTTICCSSTKQSYLDDEHHLEGQFLKQQQQQQQNAQPSRPTNTSREPPAHETKNVGRTPVVFVPRLAEMSAEELRSIMDLL